MVVYEKTRWGYIKAKLSRLIAVELKERTKNMDIRYDYSILINKKNYFSL